MDSSAPNGLLVTSAVGSVIGLFMVVAGKDIVEATPLNM
jgi:hypothetical protein